METHCEQGAPPSLCSAPSEVRRAARARSRPGVPSALRAAGTASTLSAAGERRSCRTNLDAHNHSAISEDSGPCAHTTPLCAQIAEWHAQIDAQIAEWHAHKDLRSRGGHAARVPRRAAPGACGGARSRAPRKALCAHPCGKTAGERAAYAPEPRASARLTQQTCARSLCSKNGCGRAHGAKPLCDHSLLIRASARPATAAFPRARARGRPSVACDKAAAPSSLFTAEASHTPAETAPRPPRKTRRETPRRP